MTQTRPSNQTTQEYVLRQHYDLLSSLLEQKSQLYNILEKDNLYLREENKDLNSQTHSLNDTINGYIDLVARLEAEREGFRKDASLQEKGAFFLVEQMHEWVRQLGEYREANNKLLNENKKWAKAYKSIKEKTTPSQNQEEESEGGIETSSPRYHFQDIGGLDHIIEEINQFASDASNLERCAQVGLEPEFSLLMYGPPGVGKTMIGEAIAAELEYHYVEFNLDQVISMWLGQTEKSVAKIFDDCQELYERTNKRIVLFFDEADNFFRKRGGVNKSQATDRALNIFLKKVEKAQKEFGLITVAATNMIDQIDPAVLRRFEYTIEVPLPDERGLCDILEKQVKFRHNIASDLTGESSSEIYHLNYSSLAKKMVQANFSGSDVDKVLRQAARLKMRQEWQSQPKITSKEVEDLIEWRVSMRGEENARRIGFINDD